MYLVESGYLLDEGVAGATVITDVDDFFADPDRSPEDVFDARRIALLTEHEEAETELVLAALAKHGALTTARMVRCADCGVFTPADDVERSKADGDEEPCHGTCGQDLAALADPAVVNTYQLVAPPV